MSENPFEKYHKEYEPSIGKIIRYDSEIHREKGALSIVLGIGGFLFFFAGGIVMLSTVPNAFAGGFIGGAIVLCVGLGLCYMGFSILNLFVLQQFRSRVLLMCEKGGLHLTTWEIVGMKHVIRFLYKNVRSYDISPHPLQANQWMIVLEVRGRDQRIVFCSDSEDFAEAVHNILSAEFSQSQ